MKIIKLSVLFAFIGLFSCSTPEVDTEAVLKRVEMDEWVQLMDGQEDYVILDVRTPAEYKRGHMAGALNMDFQSSDFAASLDELDKDKVYLMHCAAGGRSASTLEMMKEKGFTRVYELGGGMNEWEEAGKPVVKD